MPLVRIASWRTSDFITIPSEDHGCLSTHLRIIGRSSRRHLHRTVGADHWKSHHRRALLHWPWRHPARRLRFYRDWRRDRHRRGRHRSFPSRRTHPHRRARDCGPRGHGPQCHGRRWRRHRDARRRSVTTPRSAPDPSWARWEAGEESPALAEKRKSVITFGARGSNHVRATAVYGKQLGLRIHAILTPQPPTSYLEANLLADRAAGATLYFVDSQQEALTRGNALAN
jgi:hypothetical protein